MSGFDDLIARYLQVQAKEAPAYRIFLEDKLNKSVNLRGNNRYVDSTRHRRYVDKNQYRRVLRQQLIKLGS